MKNDWNYSENLDLFSLSKFLCLADLDDIKYFSSALKFYNDKQPKNLMDILKIVRILAKNPTITMNKLKESTGMNTSNMLHICKWVQSSNTIKKVFLSHYYPAYIYLQYAQTLFKDIDEKNNCLKKLLNHIPFAPKRLEMHPTNGTCNYMCAMCLWHVSGKAKYNPDKSTKLLSVNEWKETLSYAKKLGTQVIIFSGGGEPLLRNDLHELISYCDELGLYTMIYTNGSCLYNMDEKSDLFKSILNSDWLRVSMHATSEDIYSKLVGIFPDKQPFKKVIDGVNKLLDERNKYGSKLKIGIGFVIQKDNFNQIVDMAKLCKELKVDFLNYRVDCIDITNKLTSEENKKMYDQLRDIRQGFDNGDYKGINIDFADSLISGMNSWSMSPKIDLAKFCLVHLYRSSIDPFGRVAVCDITAEPFFNNDKLLLGYIDEKNNYEQVLKNSTHLKFDSKLCSKCMPGQQAINALWHKIIIDNQDGYQINTQPLFFKS